MKARNKKTGKIVEYRKTGDLYITTTISEYNNQYDSVYNHNEFNELYEIVEDKYHTECCKSTYNKTISLEDGLPLYVCHTCNKLCSVERKPNHPYVGILSDDGINDNITHGIHTNDGGMEVGNFDHEIMINGSNIVEAKDNLTKDINNLVNKLVKQELERICEEGEKLKREPKLIPTSCPDNMIGCLVAHFKKEYKSEDIAYNQAIDDIINIIKK